MRVDVLIHGGGVAGLWLLARLRAAGYRCLLVERGPVGGGQTVAAQGIIHGGAKFRLGGKRGSTASSCEGAPEAWRAAIAGEGPVDLRGTRVASEDHVLFSTSRWASLLGGLLRAGGVPAKRVPEEALPLLVARDRGRAWSFREPVVDVPSLLRAFHVRNWNRMVLADWLGHRPGVTLIGLSGEGLEAEVEAEVEVFVAGTGNESLLRAYGLKVGTQRRPLAMVARRLGDDFPGMGLWGHHVGFGTVPVFTATTHRRSDGGVVWWLGGKVAEEGSREPDDRKVIRAAKDAIIAAFPTHGESPREWRSEWKVVRIDRAEPAVAGGGRPDGEMLVEEKGLLVAWPVKMALAPFLAERVLRALERQGARRSGDEPTRPAEWPVPGIACAPWEGDEGWTDAS